MFTPARPDGLRIGYLSGPVDAVDVYRKWKDGRDPAYFGTSYLSHFFGQVADHGASALVISTLPGDRSDETIDGHRFVNLPMPDSGRGMRYHLAMLRWANRARSIFKAGQLDAAVLTAGQNYFFMHYPLLRAGTRIIVSLHCLLWPEYGTVPATWRWLRRLNGWTILRGADSIQCVSHDIARQVRFAVAGARPKVFVPTYRPALFEGIEPPRHVAGETFRMLFVGRIEDNKGPFDLLRAVEAIARRADMPDFRLDYCGEGGALDALRPAVSQSPVGSRCTVHGLCAADEVRRLYRSSHAVIVPTRSDFEEGYNKVCAEAVLSHRPVITSAVCPALSDVRPAAIEVEPDDIAGYADAIFMLATDSELYARKVAAAGHVRHAYFESQYSYGATLQRALRDLAARPRRSSSGLPAVQRLLRGQRKPA